MASAMDRAVMRERLEQAEQQVSDGERQVVRLRDMIAEMRRQSHDDEPALNLLHQFEQALASRIANRDRLRKELGLSG
jgi:GTP1/Obg family GTP-binding protein